MTDQQLLESLKRYCNEYDIPINRLIEIISDLKVIPMIRGKSFEFTVSDELKNILPKDNWVIHNILTNAQTGTIERDLSVIRSDLKKINVECKLSKNNSFQIVKDIGFFKVKCMRSRTVSDNEMAVRMAQNYGISKDLVLMHADSYRQQDFDFVIASLGNAFWVTKEGKYVFNGTETQHTFLKNLFPDNFKNFGNFQKEAFNFMIFAKSSGLIVHPNNNINCSRKKCIKNGTGANCEFIPNYPIVGINDIAQNKGSWKQIKYIEKEFNNFLD